jgi:hypothetical protein
MQHPSLLSQTITYGTQHGRFTATDDHLGAQMVVEVDMGGGQNCTMVIVLELGELLVYPTGVMVVHQGDGSHRLALTHLPFLCNHPLSDHVAKELGSIAILAPPNHLFEPSGQVMIDGKAESNELAHDGTSVLRLRES